VRRERDELNPKTGKKSDLIAYYATSLANDECSDEEMLQNIRDHWSAIENGIHHRRDVTFGEDACRVADRLAAHAIATLRNLAIGIYELEKDRGHVKADSCASWRRQMTFTKAYTMLRK
jgi:predicted transposase YbfD/YdcC